MSQALPVVRIGDVAFRVERREQPQPGVSYRQIGVHLWGEGAYEREPVDGGLTKYSTLSRVEAGDIVVNKIWARNGSVAVIPDALAGCYGSNEFPTFAPDRDKLEPRWIHWLTKTKSFWDQCDEKSRGTSGQNRIRPERFLEITIPLPPLDEQRRIVARIEELAGKIEEARQLRRQAGIELRQLSQGLVAQLVDHPRWNHYPVDELLREGTLNGLSAHPNDSPPGVPVLRISAATSRRDAIVDEHDVRYLQLNDEQIRKYGLQSGDLLACRFNGTLEYVGRFAIYQGYKRRRQVYPDKLIRFRVDTNVADARYVCFAMNSPSTREKVEALAATTAGNIGARGS